MSFVDTINKLLEPQITEEAIVLDLFAGCGGLSLGFEAAGFRTIGYEMDPAASETYNKNLKGKCHTIKLTPDFIYPKADIIIGGPPCQPFSVIGKQQGIKDSRDGFPIFIEAIRQTEPKVFMFENVRNLMFSHKWYFELIKAELEDLGYIIEERCMNAVHYGVPQNRERVIIVGHKSTYEFPGPLKHKVTVQEAIGDIMYDIPEDSKFLTPSQDEYIARYEKASCCKRPRDLHPELPARTLTCRNLGGATSDMQRIKLADGRRRRLTYREAARLQSFPDWFEFCGNEIQRFSQIGNAVPPLLAYKIALSVKDTYYRDIVNSKEIYKNQIRTTNLTLNFGMKLTKNAHKSPQIRELINNALDILEAVGIPFDNLGERRLEKMAMAFLAIGNITTDFKQAKSTDNDFYLKTREIIEFENEHFEENISSGSYDDIRRKDLILLVEANLAINSADHTGAATNSPVRAYGLDPHFANLVRQYNTSSWGEALEEFKTHSINLKTELARIRNLQKIPVVLPSGVKIELSAGEHNVLQKEIIDSFLPTFAKGAEVLYIGDTKDKYLVKETEKLTALNFFNLEHDELPDIVAYHKEKDVLYLIEAVHSSGPMSEIRLRRLKEQLINCTTKKVFITAFLTRKDFRKWVVDIAWETEVWIAEAPEHMVHFNGHKFLDLY